MQHTPGEKNKPGIWNPVFTCVFVANAFLFLGMQMVNTLIAKYADYLGATATIVGVVSSLFALTALVLKIFSGPAIDAFNRKTVLVVAILVIAASFFGFSISANVPALYFFRLLQGCGQAFTATCCLALAADSLPADKFGAGIGTFTLAQAVCQAIGPGIGLALSQEIGYQYAFAVAGGCTLCAVFVAMFIKNPHRQGNPFKLSLENIAAKEAVLPASLLFCLQLSFCNINAFLVIFASDRGVENIGLFFTVYAVTMLFAPVTIGKLADRYGAVKAVFPSMCLFALSFIVISFSRSLPMFLFAAVISAFGYGAAQPAVQTLCMKSVPESRRGSASGTSYIGQDLGNLIGPIIAGTIAEHSGYEFMWRTMVIPVLFTIILLLLFRMRIAGIEQDFCKRHDSPDQ
jgi:MFS family permease